MNQWHRALTHEGNSDGLHMVSFAQDGKLYSSYDQRATRIVDLASGNTMVEFEDKEGLISAMSVMASGHIVTGTANGVVRARSVQTGRRLWSTTVADAVLALSCSRDGQRVAIAVANNTILVCQGNSGALQTTLQANGPHAIAMSPDGNFVASSDGDCSTKVRSAAVGSLIRTLRGHSSEVVSVCYTADGAKIVTGSKDQTITVWIQTTGLLVLTLSGHQDRVSAVAVSDNGRFIVSGSWDETVRVWDADTGRVMQTFKNHEGGVVTVACFNSGRKILSASEDGAVMAWTLQP